ncbi:MAG TPA: sodium/proline symporter [Natrialbaceae archaeon]|nr:sodium/proline symporter [Natrialbaceae archaeon]
MVETNIYTSIGLVGYLLVVAVIGYWGSKKVSSESDFFLGGDQLPGFALGLSERCSGMSGWLLIGVPGLAYAAGLSAVWVLVGATGGAIFQWIIYSRPFMEGRKETGAVTPIGLVAEKLPYDSPVIRLLPAIITFIFYMGYVGSQFLAGGKILESIFGVDAMTGLFIIAFLIIAYSLAGGFLAVVWTDALQAMLMLVTLVALPLVLLAQVMTDPSLSLMGSLEAAGGGRASWLGGKTGAAAMLLLGTNLSWFFADLGGYPHLVVRMMAVSEEDARRTSIIVAAVWGVLTSIGAVLIGLLARTIHGSPEVIAADREMVLPFMVLEHTPGLLGGILLAGALAAMMSTADSQLVVASSAAAQDVYNKVVTKGKDYSEQTRLRISRVGTLLVGFVGVAFATTATDLVYTLVSYSATGLFSSFGPVMTLLFFWGDNLSKEGLIAAFLAGPITTVLWVSMGMTDIVTVRLVAPPVGFAAAIIASLIWSRPSGTPTGASPSATPGSDD